MKTIALLIAVLAVPQTLNVKPGLWETTMTATMSGMPQMPNVDTSKMTPQQRAQVEAAMSGMQGKPTTTRECMTQERIDHQMFQDKRMDPSCKQTVVARTATSQELKIECTGARQATGSLRFTATDPEHVKGEVSMTMGAGGRGAGMGMNSTFTAKWISADCGDVK